MARDAQWTCSPRSGRRCRQSQSEGEIQRRFSPSCPCVWPSSCTQTAKNTCYSSRIEDAGHTRHLHRGERLTHPGKVTAFAAADPHGSSRTGGTCAVGETERSGRRHADAHVTVKIKRVFRKSSKNPPKIATRFSRTLKRRFARREASHAVNRAIKGEIRVRVLLPARHYAGVPDGAPSSGFSI